MDVNAGKRCLIAKSSISLRAMLPWMRSPSTRLPVMVSNTGSSGCPGRRMMGSTSMPMLRAASLISATYALAKGSLSSASTPTRRTAGMSSRASSTLLPATSAPPLDCPVTLPPGLARLSTRPVATGSPAPAITIGMSRVACFAANADGVKNVTMRSTLRRTSSAAFSNWISGLPAAERISRRRLSALDVARVAQALAECLKERLGVR